MPEHLIRCDFDFVAPTTPLSVTLDLSPEELELAVATEGASLCGIAMKAIIAAVVVS